jgi:hypothetical protein
MDVGCLDHTHMACDFRAFAAKYSTRLSAEWERDGIARATQPVFRGTGADRPVFSSFRGWESLSQMIAPNAGLHPTRAAHSFAVLSRACLVQ